MSSVTDSITGAVPRTASISRKVALATALACALCAALAASAYAGPVVTMGIDAEDGGPGGHGPVSVYGDVMANGVLANTTNGGNGILVIGGNKAPGDNVTTFWNALGLDVAEPISYVNGAANITAQSFAGFQTIAIASSFTETASGGLTQAENDALAARQPDIAAFVNGGGGLFGTSQTGLTNTYAYLPDAGLFTFNTGLGFSDIEATPAGEAVGLTDTALDVSAWHDEYLTHPAYLTVLATNVASGNAVSLGGAAVTIPELCSNGVDDDGDALADLADPNCATSYDQTASCRGIPLTGQKVDGTQAGERLKGTPQTDRIRGLDGKDRLNGKGDRDCLAGHGGGDTIIGEDGNDIIRADGGNDLVRGGKGKDDIRLQGGSDRGRGGPGNDRIKAQGRGVDNIRCGPGIDRVIADPQDEIHRNCEKVTIV